ncbi:cysteine hydrolase family protein [Halopseudomonas pachastrellae]|uniref:cysteine hydrolase family protein n=1 Tax=Halopseudomonas pachastrellae TaxID=254161 RepID=UPI003D7EA6C6
MKNSTDETLAYGPHPDNAWHRQYGVTSLLRPAHAPQPLLFGSDQGNLELDISTSAVVVIDMQNDFCHPEGWFAQKGASMRATRRPIAPLQRLLPAWRQAGGRVVWLNWGIRADRLNLPPVVHFVGKRGASEVGYGEHSPIDHGPALVQGSWGAEVISELAPEPTDIQVCKHRLSGFWDNELDSILRGQGITSLLFAGINTDRCVFSTLQDAGFLGYDCILLRDACATLSPAYVSRAIHFLVAQCHGFVATAAALHTALASHHQES